MIDWVSITHDLRTLIEENHGECKGVEIHLNDKDFNAVVRHLINSEMFDDDDAALYQPQTKLFTLNGIVFERKETP